MGGACRGARRAGEKGRVVTLGHVVRCRSWEVVGGRRDGARRRRACVCARVKTGRAKNMTACRKRGRTRPDGAADGAA